ncbi:MFS transporter [Streptomyces sp. M10(2022)]
MGRQRVQCCFRLLHPRLGIHRRHHRPGQGLRPGAAVYTVASIGSIFAANIYLLDIARALAGLGGAAIFACGSAILSTVFSGPARAKAFALFGTVAGIGLSAGPSIAGVLLQSAGWRWVFVLHAVALGVVLSLVPTIARHAKETRREGARFDLLGSLIFIAAMFLLTCGIVQGSQWGWAGTGVLGLFAGSIAALILFAYVERRREQPMLDLTLLSNRRFLALCLVPIAGSFGFVTMLTYLPSYLTAAGGYGTGTAGLIMILLTVPMLICPLLAAKLVSRGVPAMRIIYISIACLVVGDLGLLLYTPTSPSPSSLCPCSSPAQAWPLPPDSSTVRPSKWWHPNRPAWLQASSTPSAWAAKPSRSLSTPHSWPPPSPPKSTTASTLSRTAGTPTLSPAISPSATSAARPPRYPLPSGPTSLTSSSTPTTPPSTKSCGSWPPSASPSWPSSPRCCAARPVVRHESPTLARRDSAHGAHLQPMAKTLQLNPDGAPG